MTGDRRKHSRAPVRGDGRELPGDRRRGGREPAEAHFRHLHGQRDADAAPDGAGSE